MDRLPQPPEKPPKTGSFLPLSLAGCLATLVSVALVFLTMGVVGQIAAVVAVLFAIIAFHYIVWGRWLGASIRAEVEAEQARAAQARVPLSERESHD